MIADVSPPDLETRMAILQTKAMSECMLLTDDVILYIARLITCNIRQLEGALIKLHAYASLMKTDVTATLAEEVLGRYFAENAPPVVDVRKIVEEVSKRFGIEPIEIKGTCRSKEIVLARQVAMYLTRTLTDTSLPAIAGRSAARITPPSCTLPEDRGEDRGGPVIRRTGRGDLPPTPSRRTKGGLTGAKPGLFTMRSRTSHTVILSEAKNLLSQPRFFASLRMTCIIRAKAKGG